MIKERDHMSEAQPPQLASYRRQLLLLLLILGPIALLIAWRLPVTYPEGDFIMNVLDVAKTGHVPSIFTPDTYPYLAGMAYKKAGVHGFLAEQVLIYLLLAASVLWLVRLLTRSFHAVLLCAVLICLHPDLLVSIPRVWDTTLTTLLLIVFAALCVYASRQPSPVLLLAIATLWGLGISVRPNFALLIFPLVYLLFMVRTTPRKGRSSFARPSLQLAGMLAWAFAVLLLANRLTHGSFYLARNGPYNFFAGANPYTQAALLRLLNAESSIPLALAAVGIYPTYEYDLTLSPLYTHAALLFIRTHPLQWLWLGVLKLFTLLRADTKSHPTLSLAWLVQVLTTLCVPLWLGSLALCRKLDPADKLLLVLVASYILPFLLTNADPRFRPALDVLVLCHAASLILRRRLAAKAPGAQTLASTAP